MTDRIARAVLFDLDGTLVDTAPDLCAAANAMRARAGLEPLAVAAFRPVVSRGSRAMLGRALPHLDAQSREAWVEPFLASYAEAIAVHSRLFEGIERVLQAIEADGASWGIVTNKPEALARALVRALGLESRCAVLVGGDTLPVRKPDPQPLWFACDQLGVTATAALYVGDDARDVEAARAAGMRCIAAAWGYRDGEERIEQWGADAVLAEPHELLERGALRAAGPHERG
jgi:N-acetyl-D-muramate 6-phosphate phosphatase